MECQFIDVTPIFMNALSLVVKFSVVASVLTFASGAMKDVLLGTFNGVSIKAAHVQMGQLHGKLMEFYSVNGRYPLNQKELSDYMNREFDAPLQKILLDPWKTSYYFMTENYEILSFGPDKKRDTKDDLGRPYPERVIRAWKTNTNLFNQSH